MPFLKCNIELAIATTENNLHDYFHPSFRYAIKECSSAMVLYTITGDFMAIAAGRIEENPATDESYVYYVNSSCENYLVMCKRLFEDCDPFQKEAISLLIREIVRQSQLMKDSVAEGVREDSIYLLPLAKDNSWGKAILCLAEAFGVHL